ncbi:MAG: flagellar basal-body MS-ring/collar protein FliF [Nitrospinales bacterium]
MANNSNSLKNLNERFNKLSSGKKVLTIGLATFSVAIIFIISIWVQSSDYQLLFANLSHENAGSIVEELKAQNIEYQLTNQGRNIQVPKNQVHETRITLASQGLPEGNEVGLELFEDNPLGMTDSILNINRQRALQGELSRTIKSLSIIDQARVHLVIPKKELFSRKKSKGKASVMVKVRVGKTLSQSQIQGIVRLVSGSTESVTAQDVVIIDIKGNILTGGGDGSQETLITSNNFAHKRKVEIELEQNIVKMLEEALGAGKIIARVSASMDFNKEDSTEEIYDPDSQVIRNENNSTESAIDHNTTRLSPSIDNIRNENDSFQFPTKREKEKNILNYEINKTIRRTVKPAGQIKSLSVGVLIDGTTSGDPAVYKPRSSEEMAKYLAIVKSVVGFDSSRKDQINVENVQFDKTFDIKIEEPFFNLKYLELGIQIFIIILAVIFLILLFTKILPPILSWLTSLLEEPLDSKIELPSKEGEPSGPDKNQTPSPFEAADIRKTLLSYIDSDPKHAAGILRKWMRDRNPV